MAESMDFSASRRQQIFIVVSACETVTVWKSTIRTREFEYEMETPRELVNVWRPVQHEDRKFWPKSVEKCDTRRVSFSFEVSYRHSNKLWSTEILTSKCFEDVGEIWWSDWWNAVVTVKYLAMEPEVSPASNENWFRGRCVFRQQFYQSCMECQYSQQ